MTYVHRLLLDSRLYFSAGVPLAIAFLRERIAIPSEYRALAVRASQSGGQTRHRNTATDSACCRGDTQRQQAVERIAPVFLLTCRHTPAHEVGYRPYSKRIMAYAFSRLRSTFWTSGGNVLPGLRRARPRRRRLARSHSIGRKRFVCVRRQTRGEPRLFIRLAARGCRYLQNPHQILVSGTGPSRIDVDRNISTRAVCSVVRTDGRMSAQLSHQAHESVLGRRYDDPPPP